MSLKAKSKAYMYQGKMQIYVPSEIVSDSAFPFPTDLSTEVTITINGNKLVVEKAKR